MRTILATPRPITPHPRARLRSPIPRFLITFPPRAPHSLRNPRFPNTSPPPRAPRAHLLISSTPLPITCPSRAHLRSPILPLLITFSPPRTPPQSAPIPPFSPPLPHSRTPAPNNPPNHPPPGCIFLLRPYTFR